MDAASLERAAVLLATARRVSVLTGAGISAESGVPTFRSHGGLWESHRIEDVATPEAVQRNPRLVWEFYEMRRKNMQSVEPNPGHLALAELEPMFESFTLVTQNIDGLHQRAGSGEVLEVHGSLWRAHCHRGCGRVVDPFPYPAYEIPPPCECGSFLRPSVVLFGEMLPHEVFERAVNAAVRSDVALSIGTSSAVWPAAGIPLITAEAGGTVIEINPEPTELTGQVDVSLQGPSGEVLPRLVELVREVAGGDAK
jgi:NAD-dependent deacetylase